MIYIAITIYALLYSLILLWIVRTAGQSITIETVRLYAYRMYQDDRLDILVDIQSRFGIKTGNKIAQLAYELYLDELQYNYEGLKDDKTEYLKDHPLSKIIVVGTKYTKKGIREYRMPLYKLLINPWTKNTLETVSPKVFRILNGKNPSPANLLNGRVRIHDAIDSIATELGYEYADDMVEAIREVI